MSLAILVNMGQKTIEIITESINSGFKDFLLVLLGALISCGTTWFLDGLRFKREVKIKNREMRKDVYQALYEFFVTTYKLRNNDIKKEDIKNYNYVELQTKVELFASNEFKEKLIGFVEQKPEHERTIEFLTKDEIGVLQGIIRKDLMIEDK